MSSKIQYIVFLALSIWIFSCIEEFNPPSEGYENLLVVEGYLTNKTEESEVRLSRSIPLDTTAWIPESRATVTITKASGEVYPMIEIKEGVYNLQSNVNARVGQDYQLNIITANGKRYESEWVTMIETPPIDSIIWRYEERPVLGLKGIQIYVNTHDPENNTWYYRWHWNDTWIFRTAYNSTLMWKDGRIQLRDEQIHTCWKNTRSNSILVASSKILDNDVIYNFPLLYVGNNTDRLAMRYSLNVKQYALSEKSYNYWSELDNVTENLGTLFDPLPATLKGNIYNANNPNETVIGFFDAATVQEERIFIDVLELPFMHYPKYYQNCMDTVVGSGLIGEMILRGFELVGQAPNSLTSYLMTSPPCVDCRFAGTNKKPEFW